MGVNSSQLFIALDFSDLDEAVSLAERLAPLGVGFKVGLELFMTGGPEVISALSGKGDLFLDLKYHDIPNTVAAAVRKASILGVKMINVHAAGGSDMMKAAREACGSSDSRPLLVAVTILTSMNDSAFDETGCPGLVEERVIKLSRLARQCGLDGVVCSPLEIRLVKENLGKDFLTVTPGIRPAGAALGDQVRIATPGEVILAGGDYLVVGRPVTAADDPLEAVRSILKEMGVNNE